MGSQAPNNDTKKGETCDVCKKEFQTIQALRCHQLAKHKSSPKSATKKEPAKKKKIVTDSEKPESVNKEKVIQENTPASRVSKRLQLKKDRKSDMKENLSKPVTLVKSRKEPVKSLNVTKFIGIKTEFDCPLCGKTFSMLFSATKHIEKKHALTGNSSKELINLTPIRIERCMTCSETITNKDHMCRSEMSSSAYKCLGCQKKFSKLELFNKHTITNHGADTDYMNFRGIHGFLTWKVNMEAQIKGKYSVFDKSTKEQHYQCNYVSPKNQMDITYLCPSVIITKQLNDRLEIQYYKRHFGHPTPTYQLPDEYKKNMISKNELESAITEKVYQKFKNLMDSVITDASKTNLDNLKKLLSMAINMRSYLDEEEMEISLTNKSMTDNQISEELEEKSNVKAKRRAVTPDNLIVKRPKVKNSFDALISPIPNSPPSFNDSYKQFIDSTITETMITTKPYKTVAKKEVVKTKIGQFSPKKTSPKNEIEKKPNVLRPSKNNSSSDIFGKINIKDVKYEVREQENDCNILVLKI